MKRLISKQLQLIAIALVFLSVSLQAQDFGEVWQWKNPFPSSNALYAACSNSSYLAVGGANGYLTITNSPNSHYSFWHEQPIPIYEDITAMCYVGEMMQDLMIFTNTGKVLQSDGTLLTNLNTRVSKAVVAGSTIWLACSDGLYSSTDKSTFTKKQMPASGLNFTSIMFVGDKGWATTTIGKIFSTSNGGSSWAEQTTGNSKALNSVYFVNSEVGWAAGIDGLILHTTSGGQSWEVQQSPTTFVFHSCYFTDEQTGWVTGTQGEVVYTTNGGASWELSNVENIFGELNCITTLRENLIITSSNGEIVIGTKSSKWLTNITHSIIGFNLRHIHSQGGSFLAVGENGAIIRSEDRGETWQSVASGYNKRINACALVGNDTAYFSTEEGTIYRSLDNGKTWKKQTTVNDKEIMSMSFDYNYGLMVGRNGAIQSTNNSGKNWTLEISGTKTSLLGVFLDKNNAWICGEEGLILKSTSYGVSWEPKTSTVNTALNDIIVKGNIGYAVGVGGVLLKTENAGDSWTKVSLPTTDNLNRIYLHENGRYAIVVGDNSTMFVSRDGNSWEKMDLHFKGSIFGVCVMYDGLGGFWNYICGSNGMLMNSYWIPASVESDNQYHFSVARISPNPVLNTLRIQKTEELANLNSIEIYNYSGELIQTYQVTQNNSSDNYEFDTRNITAGAYIIKLKVDNNTYYLKMIKQ